MNEKKTTPYQRAAKGVAFREHEVRRHGKRLDRYYCLIYKRDGKTIREGVGWSSDGATQAECEKLLVHLRDNWRSGTGPQSLAGMRAERQEKAEAQKAEQKAAKKTLVTFSEFWEAEYWPAQASKTWRTREAEEGYYRKWIAPALGDIQLQRIDVAMLDGLKNRLIQAGRTPGTIQKVLSLARQVWNHAVARDVLQGPCPVQRVKVPKRDAARQRFLTPAEAARLLQALRMRSADVHDQALLALFCGLRAGEIFNLTVADCNFVSGTIFLRDTKSGKNRHAYMTPEVEEMLRRRIDGKAAQDLLFPAKSGGVRKWVSDTFDRTVTELGFNEGIADARQKVVFHTLRHSFASWLVQRGTPLFEVAKLMGHSTIRMTERYSHLAPDAVRRAALGLGGILNREPGKVVIPFAKMA